MRKSDCCLSENKGADQLRSHCEADQHLCFRYSDSTISLLPKSEISSLCLYSSVCIRPGRKPRRMVFSSCGSYFVQYMYNVLVAYKRSWCEKDIKSSGSCSYQGNLMNSNTVGC